MRAFIFLGGGTSKKRFYSRHLAKTKAPGDIIICADGGYSLASSLDIRPDLVIGDLDSVPEKEIIRGIEVIRYPQEKNFSDFELALNRAIDLKADHVFVYGGLGGRSDHQIVNIVLLAHSPVPMVFVEEHALLFNVSEYWTITGKKGCTCTLLTLEPACRVTDMQGFRYNLKNEDLVPSSRGLSNVIENDEAHITVSEGSLIVIVLY
jgi:thiamine pyrophosphokinase